MLPKEQTAEIRKPHAEGGAFGEVQHSAGSGSILQVLLRSNVPVDAVKGGSKPILITAFSSPHFQGCVLVREALCYTSYAVDGSSVLRRAKWNMTFWSSEQVFPG